MEVICEIGICSREERMSRGREGTFPRGERSRMSRGKKKRREKKNRETGRDLTRVIKIFLRENADILRNKIANALRAARDSPYCLLSVALESFYWLYYN